MWFHMGVCVSFKWSGERDGSKRKFRTPGDGMRRALDSKCSSGVNLRKCSSPPPYMPAVLSVSRGFGLGPYRKARGGSMGLWAGRPGQFFFHFFHFCLRWQAKSPTGLTLWLVVAPLENFWLVGLHGPASFANTKSLLLAWTLFNLKINGQILTTN